MASIESSRNAKCVPKVIMLGRVTIVSRRTASTNALPLELAVETALKGRHATAFSVDPGGRQHCYNRTLLHGWRCQWLQTSAQGMMYTNNNNPGLLVQVKWLE
jgi:hypothetical protein